MTPLTRPPQPPSTYGQRLRAERLRMGLSFRELAGLVGTSHVTIRALEHGLYEPRDDMAERIGEVLDVWPRSHELEALVRAVTLTYGKERMPYLIRCALRRVEEDGR